MFDDCDEIWRVYNRYGGTFTVLRGKINYEEEARKQAERHGRILGQKQKKIFSDLKNIWRTING